MSVCNRWRQTTKTSYPECDSCCWCLILSGRISANIWRSKRLSHPYITRRISRLCLSCTEIKASHSSRKFLLHPHRAAHVPSIFSFTSSSPTFLLLFPKQCVSDTCNIPVAGVLERNQRHDLSLLTLSVACPLFLWSFYYRSAICSISAAHHGVQL